MVLVENTKTMLNGITPLLVNTAGNFMAAPLGNKSEYAFFYLKNEDVIPTTITFKAGDGSHSAIGDAVFQLEPGQEYIAGPFEEVRFKRLRENKIYIEASGNTDKIKIGKISL